MTATSSLWDLITIGRILPKPLTGYPALPAKITAGARAA